MTENIFVLTLVAIGQMITYLESFANSTGVNVSNWVTQIIGNDAISYPFDVIYTLKDGKKHKLPVQAEFVPAKTHRDCGDYFEMLKHGNAKNPDVAVLSFMGYILCGMLLGKLPAIVNQGRALILDRIFKELNLTDLTLVIHKYSTGGKNPEHDIDYTYPEIKAQVKAFTIRAQRITNLPKKSAELKSSTNAGITSTDGLKIVDVD